MSRGRGDRSSARARSGPASRVNAGTGSTYVTQVITYDANGSYQVTSVNAISPQNPTVQLALANGASTTKVVIDGHSDWGGSIAMQAI